MKIDQFRYIKIVATRLGEYNMSKEIILRLRNEQCITFVYSPGLALEPSMTNGLLVSLSCTSKQLFLANASELDSFLVCSTRSDCGDGSMKEM